jgi:hypothetical protein
MIVIYTDGILTLEQRDSRETLGGFVTRAILSHGIRLRTAGEAAREPQLREEPTQLREAASEPQLREEPSQLRHEESRRRPLEQSREESRRAVFELRGCGYR